MSRRIELGISLEQAARDTNIRARMLEALESGDYSQYPPRGHAIGMLSSYARYLDLDSASIVEVFDSEYEAYSSSREIEKIANNTRRGVGRFGERVIGEKSRPISRESSRSSRSQRKRGGEGEGEGTSKLSRNLKDEAEAKDDERYRSGSVRVVGTRQTGSFRAVRSARGSDTGSFEPTTRSRTASSRRGTSGRSSRRPSGVDEFTARPTEDLSRSGEERTPNFFGIDVDTGKTAVSHGRRRRPSTRSDVSEQTAGDDGIIARARRIVSSIFSERRTRLIAVAVITIVIAIIIAASVLISTAGHGNSGHHSRPGWGRQRHDDDRWRERRAQDHHDGKRQSRHHQDRGGQGRDVARRGHVRWRERLQGHGGGRPVLARVPRDRIVFRHLQQSVRRYRDRKRQSHRNRHERGRQVG